MCSNWLVATKKGKWRKQLATAVTLGILCGGYQQNVQAAEYNGKLTSNIVTDNLVVDGKASLEGNTVKYNFTENTILTNSYSWQELAALGITTDNQGYIGTIQPGGPTGPTASSGEYHNMLFDLNGHDFTVNHVVDTGIGQINPANPSAGAYISSTPLYIAKPVSMTFDNIGKMTLNNQSTGYYLAGIYAGYYRGLNTEEQELAAGRPTIVINNENGWDNAVTVTAGGGQYSENITGIKIFNCGELIIKGYADFAKDTKDAEGNVISTKYYGLDVNTMGNRVNSSAHFAVGGGRWGKIYGYGNSLLELNTVKDELGNVSATDNDVEMVGDIQTYGSYSTDITAVNLGLTTPDSYWLGATYSGNENQVENLFLRNGGCWINNGARVSNIVNLHGGSSKENVGILRFSNTKAGASISNYDGNLVAMYEHEDATPATMLGGDIAIKSAAANSSITLQTSNNGIDVTNEVAVNGVLDSLANKLFYTGYITGERNLAGKVKIAEGLTTTSVEKAVGDVWYDIETGKGNYLKNILSDYNTVLTGTAYDQQYVGGGLYYADGDIRSKNATNISVNDGPAIDVAKNINLVIDMLGNNWNISSTAIAKNSTAVSVDKNGSLTINNMGNVVVGADGTSSVGLYAGINADGQATDKASITINKNGTNTLKFNGDSSKDYTVIKAGKQGDITISSLMNLSEDLQNSAKTTIFDADGGNITYAAGRDANILKTAGYLVKANNGAQVKLGNRYSGCADILQGDILINKGTSSDPNSTYVFLSLNKNQVWTGSAGGDGNFAVRMGISGLSTSNDTGGIWYNQWLDGSNLDTHVATLDVYASLPANIYQKNSGKLYLDEISNGGVNIYYEHDKNNVTAIAAGDTIIGHGTTKNNGTKTEVFLKTDNTGIDMTSKEQVTAVLKSLANKLTYSGYIAGESDVNGHVEIMEGLLTSSAKIAGGLVNFNETTGQAFYSPQNANMFSTVLTGGEDTEYVSGGIKDGQSYLLKENTTIETSYDKKEAVYAAIDIGSGKNVDLNLAGNLLNVKSNAEIESADDSIVAGVNVRSGSSLNFTNGDLNISTTGNCKQAYGIYASGDAGASAQNMLTITQKDIGGDFDVAKVLRISGITDGDVNFTAIKAIDNANITISSKTQVDAEKGVAILADNGSNVQMTVSSSLYNEDSQNSYVNAAGGKLIVAGKNSKVSLTNIKKGDYLKGDVVTDINGEGGEVNIALNGDSQWSGSTAGKGIFNISLNTGLALWNNEWQQGSGDTQVAFLKGTSNNGSPFGVIYQKNDGKLNINSFTGIVGIHYDHNVDDPAAIIGGDTVIKSSVAGGGWNKQNVVFVRTDPNGIDLNDEVQVNKTLNALANKIYYKDAINGGSASGYSLKGSAAITESITGGSRLALGLKSGSISFNNKTGQGYYYYAAPEQIASEFGNTLTGHNMIIDKRATDYEYAQGGVIDNEGKYVFKTLDDTVANRIAVDDVDTITIGKDESAIVSVVGIAAQDVSIKLAAENTLDVTAKATETGKEAIGIYTNSGKTADLSADNLAITSSSENGSAYGIYNDGDTNINKNLSIKSSGTGILAASGSVKVAGHATIETNGTGVQTGTNGELQLVSAEIKAGEGKDAINAVGGKIILNADENGLAIVSGNISASNSGIIDLTISGSEAYFSGNIVNDSSTIKMKLKNGAVWTNTDNGSNINGAYINTFIGGDSKVDAGIIKQESNNAITFNNYSGNTKVIYEHKEEEPKTILGGGVVIGTAAKDSSITLITDYKGIGTSNDNVLGVFEALANKLTYEGGTLKKSVNNSSDSINLSGTLEIAEGLLTSSATMKTSDLSFDSNGQGHVSGTVLDIDPDTGTSAQHTSDITYGNKQTAMMRGAKSAMVSSALAWRSENNDVMKRLGDLRIDANAEKGIWAKIGGGKTSYDDNDTNYKTTFKSYQLGYDKTVGNAGWIIGAAFSYLDGDSSYEKGSGTNKAASISLYGSWLGDKGHYADIILRGSNVKADYKVYNDYGYKLEGDYNTMGMAVSAEYGRRIKTGTKGFYYEPQVELTYSRLGSDSYNAHSNYLDGTNLRVRQNSFDSLIGRIGMSAGIQNKDCSTFVKASLLHEFLGDFDTKYSAAGEQTKSTNMNFGDTYVSVLLGNTARISSNSFVYANLEKTFGGDVKMDWRADVGFRFTF